MVFSFFKMIPGTWQAELASLAGKTDRSIALALLKVPQLQFIFQEFCAENFCEENVLFLKEVRSWKHLAKYVPVKERNIRALQIYDTFLTDNSMYEVTLPDTVRQQVQTSITNHELWETPLSEAIFDDAYDTTLRLVETDIVPRFTRSALFRDRIAKTTLMQKLKHQIDVEVSIPCVIEGKRFKNIRDILKDRQTLVFLEDLAATKYFVKPQMLSSVRFLEEVRACESIRSNRERAITARLIIQKYLLPNAACELEIGADLKAQFVSLLTPRIELEEEEEQSKSSSSPKLSKRDPRRGSIGSEDFGSYPEVEDDLGALSPRKPTKRFISRAWSSSASTCAMDTPSPSMRSFATSTTRSMEHIRVSDLKLGAPAKAHLMYSTSEDLVKSGALDDILKRLQSKRLFREISEKVIYEIAHSVDWEDAILLTSA